MIYSLWNPVDNRYSYFSAPKERRGSGDDLPTPVLPKGTDIGVASTEAGRPIPAGAKAVGTGAMAKGVVAPMDRTGLLSGIPGAEYLGGATGYLLAFAVGLVGGFFAHRKGWIR